MPAAKAVAAAGMRCLGCKWREREGSVQEEVEAVLYEGSSGPRTACFAKVRRLESHCGEVGKLGQDMRFRKGIFDVGQQWAGRRGWLCF